MVASSQAKLYMTYNGGPVFNLENTEELVSAKAPATQVAGSPAEALKNADAYSRRGAALMSRHQYDNAVADFTRAAAMEPTSSAPLIARGEAYVAKDQPALALADFTAALTLKPDDVEGRMARGQLLAKQGDVAGAKTDFDAAIRLDPSQSWRAAYAYQKADRFAEAVGETDAWIAANPKSDELVQWLNARCWTRALWGQQLDKAEADCDAALRLDPNNGAILDSRGLVRLRRGELDPAIADYNAALKQLPKDAWSLYGRGVARLRKGLKAEGDADIVAAVAADPDVVTHAKKLGIAP
jgi:tetratricopeptide (TPR) repeat protein